MNATLLLEIICAELLKVVMPGITRTSIVPESLLIEELGVDSLKFVELTVGLEAALALEEFPMQQWIDERMSRDQPLTVQALVSVCDQLLRSRASSAPSVVAWP
jgi:acyl carrier protein